MKGAASGAGADGGTLLVDDAYQLDPSGSPVGKRVLQKLVAEMDAFPGTLAVVLCGYDKDMEQMLASSPGLRSRFRRDVAFEDFSDDELVEITRRRFDERFPKYAVADDKHLRIAARRLGKGRGTPGFGNARAAAQLLESASEKQSARVVASRPRATERPRERSTERRARRRARAEDGGHHHAAAASAHCGARLRNAIQRCVRADRRPRLDAILARLHAQNNPAPGCCRVH